MSEVSNKKGIYPGSKNGSGTYQHIINNIPPHSVYFELFLGSGAIFRKKRCSSINILMDMVPVDQLPFSLPFSENVFFINFDALSFIENMADILNFLDAGSKKFFMYLDPPYFMPTRKSSKPIYKYEFGFPEHIRFLKGVTRLNFPVMISHYQNFLYDFYLRNWKTYEFMSMTRNGLRKEVLYMNYDHKGMLHDYSYIGSNFKNRERLALIKKNVLSKFSRMSPELRNSILTELKSIEYE